MVVFADVVICAMVGAGLSKFEIMEFVRKFLQNTRSIFRRKPRQRGLCGTPLLEAAREAKRQAAEPYICVTMLLRMTAENKDSQRDTE